MREKGERVRRKKSLKWGLITIVLGCWVLPITVIGITIGLYMVTNVNQQIVQTVTSNVQNNVNICTARLDSAVYASRFATYDQTIDNAYKKYLMYKDGVTFYDTVQHFLDTQYKYDEKFTMTMLQFDDDWDQYVYNTQNRASYEDILYYKNNVKEEVRLFAQGLGTGIGFYQADNRVYMVRNLMGSNYESYGILSMQLNLNNLFDGIKSVPWGTDVSLMLNDCPVVLKGQAQDISSLLPDMPPDGSRYTSQKSRSQIYGRKDMDSYRLYYCVLVDSSALVDEFFAFRDVVIWMAALVVPLLFLALRYFFRNVSQPVGIISKYAHFVEIGQFGVQITENFYNTEFQYMADSFNEMSAKLKTQFDRIYREELALRDARIMALQSQINPHFLNNTLEIINWEARLADNIKVARMIESLSTMLDAAMDRKGKPTVHLSEEMMYVDAYLYIIAERLGKRLTVKKEIDNGVLDLYVPRLVLQPIIENAVEHGINPLQKGTIIIRGYLKDSDLVLEIENDGIMTKQDEERIEQLLSEDYDASGEGARSLGIRNVHQRLRILYGEESGLSIKMNAEGRAVARIVIQNAEEKK